MQTQVLLVDNNEIFLKLMAPFLTGKGCEVRTAPDGLTALEILKRYAPEIIFIDLVMPNIDGSTLCRMIRKNKKFADTTIAILSAIAIEDSVDFQSFGADACIAKGPITEIEKYIELILDHVRENRVSALPDAVLGYEHIFSRTVTRELLEMKRDFEITLDNMDSGYMELSPDGKIIRCNRFAIGLFQKREDELLGTRLLDHFHGLALGLISKSMETFNAKKSTVELEQSISLSGRDIVIKLVHIPLDEGSTTFVFFKDITTEKQAIDSLKCHMEGLEKTVKERTEEYQKINKKLQEKIRERKRINEELDFVARQWSKTFDTIPDFVSVHDKNMKLVRVNKALASHLGKDPEELLGKHCYELMHGRKSPWPGCPHIAAVQTGETVTAEIDDTNIGISLLVTCAPFLHDDGSLMGTVHVARDISRQREDARERETLIKELEESLSKVKQLSGFLPICASCKKIRDDKGYWSQVEEYVTKHSEAVFSHSICPDCVTALYPDFRKKS